MGQIQFWDCQFAMPKLKPENFVKSPTQNLLLSVALVEPWTLIPHPPPPPLPPFNPPPPHTYI